MIDHSGNRVDLIGVQTSEQNFAAPRKFGG